jgi:hypothetical protein
MQDLGNSMPLAEGMVDAESANKSTDLSDTCLNCGSLLTGTYCSQCGQKNIPKRQTLGELFENFLGSFFSYESKFFKTIRYLLFRPGFLAKEYNAGRRERYYHPARMYVFISFIYFLLFFSLPDRDDKNNVIDNDGVVKTDSTDNFNFKLTSNEYKNREEYDSVQAALPESERDGWFVRKMQYRSLELNEKYKTSKSEFTSDFGESFAANTPKVLFFLLPIFALLLKLLYIRRDFYYSEHLVLSIYFYNFFFAAGSITLLLELIPGMDWISVVMSLLVISYLFLAMKKVYKQGWGKTFFKFLLLSFSFLICLGIGLLINLAITLLII